MLFLRTLSKRQSSSSIFKTLFAYNIKNISYEQYLQETSEEVIAESIIKSYDIKTIQHKRLDENIEIYGIPYQGEDNAESEVLFKELDNILLEKEDKENEKISSISLLHLDPTLHLFKKRKLFTFLQNKFLFKGLVDNKDMFSKDNPCKLIHPFETFLEPVILEYEYRQRNSIPIDKDFDLTSSEQKNNLIKGITQSIQENIELTDPLTNYDLFFQIMLIHYFQRRKVYLAEIPAVYFRMIIANNFSLEEIIEEYKEALKKLKQDPENNLQSFSNLAFSTMNEAARFFYIRSLIEEILQINENQQFKIFFRMDRFLNFQKYFDVDNLEHSWEKAFDVPIKSFKEPDEKLIEKHALLEIMFETRLWNQNYIGNPFPYISEDFHSLKEEDAKELGKKFYISYKKFEKIKNEFLKN